MTFDEILAQVLVLLQREGRVSYRALKRRLHLNDEDLEDLKDELIAAKQWASDAGGKVLVWTGGVTALPGKEWGSTPSAFTPQYLSEKILTSRTALEGDLAYERFGQVGLLSVLSHTSLVGCLAEVGAFAEGIASGEAGMRIAEAANHPFSLITAGQGLGRLYLIKGDLPQAIPLLERSLSLCQEAGVPVLFPPVAATLGAAYTLAQRLPEALPLLEQAVEQAAAMGTRRAQAIPVS